LTAKLIMTAAEVAAHPVTWKDFRRGTPANAVLTASEFPVLLGLVNPKWGTPFSLYVDKLTGTDDTSTSDEATRGRVLEPYVAERFAAMRPELEILPGGLYASAEHPWLMATFDRLALDCDTAGMTSEDREGAALAGRILRGHPAARGMSPWAARNSMPVELKTAHQPGSDPDSDDYWGEPGTDQVPARIKVQALIQMEVWGADEVLIPVQFMLNWQLWVYVVRRTDTTEADIAWMIGQGEEFRGRLARRDPPDVDEFPRTLDALKSLTPMRADTTVHIPLGLAVKYQRAYRAKKRAESRVGLLVNQIAKRAGDAKRVLVYDPVVGEDRTVLIRSTYPETRVDIGDLRERFPEQAAACERTATVDKYTPGRKWVS
jgi:YqaJ-like viral recombinase domain